jgi:hypothetical protein
VKTVGKTQQLKKKETSENIQVAEESSQPFTPPEKDNARNAKPPTEHLNGKKRR